jgi:phosphatidylserine decarboxylase
MKNNLFIVAKSGWSYLGYSAAACLLFFILDMNFLLFLSLLSMLFFLYIFRNPEREMPLVQKSALISPVDGVISAVEELEGSEYRYKIEIDSSCSDVAVLRLPMNAKAISSRMVNGTRVSKKSKLFSALNEYAEIVFLDNEGNSVKIKHQLKQSFAPIDIDLPLNQELLQSARYGCMVNGVTTLFIQSNFRLNVKVGEEVKASTTLLGYFS